MQVSILSYGAVPGGEINCAPAVQKAIDEVSAAGGGRVTVPAGVFLCGSVLLKSHVNLYLEKGAVLRSSLNPEDILPFPTPKDEEGIDGWNGGFFLGARDAADISVTGEGTLAGQGEKVFSDPDVDHGFHECPKRCAPFRPRMTLFENIEDLTITGITFLNAAFWTLHMAGCRRVQVRNIRILNDDRGANNDGIDPDCCQDVIISGCMVSTGDDAIVLKSTGPMAKRYGDCRNIVITGCVLHSRDSALKIGTETHGTISDVIFSDSIVDRCSRAVGLWVRDGGSVENISVHHLTGSTRRYADAYAIPGNPGWWGKGEPIFVSCTPRKGKEGQVPGVIRNLSFSNIRLTCESSLFLGGESYAPIENVRLNEIEMTFRHTGTQPGGLFDEQPSGRHVYPHTIPALYARSVNGLHMNHCTVTFCGEKEAWDGTLCEMEDCDHTDVSWEKDT